MEVFPICLSDTACQIRIPQITAKFYTLVSAFEYLKIEYKNSVHGCVNQRIYEMNYIYYLI